MIAATRFTDDPSTTALWALAILALGFGIGALNGLLISLLKLQPFLVTLATWSILNGVAMIILPTDGGSIPSWWVGFASAQFIGLTSPVWMLLALLLFWWWFHATRVGITIQASGSNEKSAFLSGVSITRVNLVTYGLSGLFAAGAALFLVTQTGAGSPTIGKDYILPSVAAAVIGGVIGLVNGVGVARFGVPPIIMTLATNVILQGLILVLTGGSPTPSAPALIQFLSVGRIGGFPVIALIWLALTLVATLLLSKAAFGRHLYALGTSATVAEFSGVPTARTTILTYVASGLTAAFAGMLLTGYSGQAYLGMGDAYLFTSIAAVAIGGASILGGSGHYLGTVAGAMVLTILTGLLPALNLSSGALLIVYGAVILLTVSIGSEAFAGLGGRLRRN